MYGKAELYNLAACILQVFTRTADYSFSGKEAFFERLDNMYECIDRFPLIGTPLGDVYKLYGLEVTKAVKTLHMIVLLKTGNYKDSEHFQLAFKLAFIRAGEIISTPYTGGK